VGGSVGRTGETDWAIIFDLIAAEYGYTWNQFISFTYKQLNASLEAIARRTHNKTVVRAAMHGIKLDLYQRVKPASQKQLKQAEDEIQKLLKEKQKAAKSGKR
jgi:hypothetical protein